jgi:hypothetical protein
MLPPNFSFAGEAINRRKVRIEMLPQFHKTL